MRYDFLGHKITTGQWNLVKIVCNKFDDRVDAEGNFNYRENFGLMCVMMKSPEEEIKELCEMGLLKAGTKPDTLRMVGKTRMGLQPRAEPSKPGQHRPIVSRRWTGSKLEIGEVAMDAMTRLAEQGLRVNADVAAMLDDVDQWANAQVAASVKQACRKAGEVVYSDTFVDWRGRVYMQTGAWGSPQQSRLMRALMEAPEAKPLDLESEAGVYFLELIEDEYDVTITNYGDILDTAIRNSHDALRYRAALALAEVITSGATAYLLEQDASCSGGQIIAHLTGDRDLASAVNACVREGRGDLYLTLADDASLDRMWHLLGLQGDDNRSIRRQLAKPVVMVSFYGGGEDSIVANLWEAHDGEFDAEGEMIGTVEVYGFTITPQLAAQIVRGLCMQLDRFAGFKAFKSWGTSNGQVLANDDVTAQWETATGFVAIGTPGMRASGLMPNYIHSVDGAIVQTVLVDPALADACVVTIHDAFLTTPDRALELRDAVRRAYVAVIEATEVPNWGGKDMQHDEDFIHEIMDAKIVGV